MKYRFLILICLLPLFSCEDTLTVLPENSTTFSNGMDDEREFDAAVNGIVYNARSYLTWQVVYPEARAYLADEVAFGDFQKVQALEDNTGHADNWSNIYPIIMQANLLKQGLLNVDLPEERHNYYMGQVAFFKALAYKFLVQRFGDVIIVKDNIILEPVAKSPMCEVVDYAIEQAKIAAKLLPEYPQCVDRDGNNPLQEGCASKGAANALLAELCLWQVGTKWFAPNELKSSINETELLTVAEDACSQVINSGTYAMESTSELCTKTLLDGGKACILKAMFRGFVMPGIENHSMASFPSIASWPLRDDENPNAIAFKSFRLTSDYVRAMYVEEDERRQEFFHRLDDPLVVYRTDWNTGEILYDSNGEPIVDPVKSMNPNYAYPNKFREGRFQIFGGGQFKWYEDFDQDIIVYRLAQIYLMRAEARAKLAKDQLAVEDVNTVRSRAGAPAINLSDYENDALLAVFMESDRELLFEQGRYYRVIRFGERMMKRFLKGNFKTLSEQDARDGALFDLIVDEAFEDNPLLRQNLYWSRRK